MRFDPKLVGNYTIPALHGGTIGGLLESSAAFLLLVGHELVVLPKVISITVDYLRSGRPVDAVCRAEVVRQGKRICVVAVRAFQDDPEKPIAAAMVHLLVAADEA